MPKFNVLVARDISEYANVEIDAPNEQAATREALSILTMDPSKLDGKWSLGDETDNERIVYCEELENAEA